MMKFLYLILISLFLMVFLGNCQRENPNTGQKKLPDKNTLIKTNCIVTASEENIIEDYIRRYKWDMARSGSGLRYMIYKKSTGEKPIEGKVVKLNYNLQLINGTTCYSSAESGPKMFRIGKSNAERGLEEGVLLMRKGEKAKFILPSHLGFGLTGDFKKIPPRAILIYDVELTDINK